MEFENPLTNVVNPLTTRIRIEQTEEEIRTNEELSRDQKLEKLTALGKDYAEIGQREKAIAYLKTVLRAKAQPDATVLHRMAMISSELGDTDGERKYYIAASKADPRWGGSLFNLALAQQRRGEIEEAVGSLEAAIERERDTPYLVLRAEIADQLGDKDSRDKLLAEAITAFGPPKTLDSFELSWLSTALRMEGDEEALAEVAKIRRERARANDSHVTANGELPDRLVILPQ